MMPGRYAPTCASELHDAQRAQVTASAPPDVLVLANCVACGDTLAVCVDSLIENSEIDQPCKTENSQPVEVR